MTVISLCTPVTISKQELPTAELYLDYYFRIDAKGGRGDYEWDVEFSKMPSGLRVDGNCIRGIPLETGDFAFQVRVTDRSCTSGDSAKMILKIRDNPFIQNLEILAKSLPSGSTGKNYSFIFPIRGGMMPIKYNLYGSLPPGLEWNSSTGELSGIAKQAGVWKVQIEIVDSLDERVHKDYELKIEKSEDKASVGSYIWIAFICTVIGLLLLNAILYLKLRSIKTGKVSESEV